MPEEIDPTLAAAEMRAAVQKMRTDIADLESKLQQFDARTSRTAADALKQISKALNKIVASSRESP